jgi:branched-chain amino acid aminotransferase
MEAKLDGYSEGIMLDSQGFVAEGSGENLFAVRENVLYTAPLSAGILNGITRDSIIRIARDRGLEVREQLMPREFLYVVDELFFCGTAAEITPIKSVDRIPVGNGRPGDVTRTIQQEYLGIARGSIPDRFGWLTMVPEPAALAR